MCLSDSTHLKFRNEIVILDSEFRSIGEMIKKFIFSEELITLSGYLFVLLVVCCSKCLLFRIF